MNPWKREIQSLLQLAIPIVAVQIGLMGMGIVDTIMVGHLPGETVEGEALGQVAIGHAYGFFWIVFGLGALMAVDPLVAQAVGAGDRPAIARAFQRSLVVAGILAVPIMIAMALAGPCLKALGQPPGIVNGAATYTGISALGLLPFLAFAVFRQGLQAMNRLAPTVLTMLGANVANIGFNWVLVYGNLGFPQMGVAGSAWATVLSRWLMAGVLLAFAWRDLRPFLVPWRSDTLRRSALLGMMRLGLPIGVQNQLEVGVFAATALLMGYLGEVVVAGHQVALHLAAFTFMVPMGISGAAAVRVGQAVGRRDPAGARRAAAVSLALSVAVMAAFAVAFLLWPRELAGIWTDKEAVVAVAVVLIPIAAVFQVFDGFQVVAIGVLRGVGETRTPAVTAIVGFWFLGFPFGWYLGRVRGMGPEGFWWGLVVGLVAVAVFLGVRVAIRLRRDLLRTLIDESDVPLESPVLPGVG
jgi:MATE family multidrug resistance protein